jgi:hypothetical protein
MYRATFPGDACTFEVAITVPNETSPKSKVFGVAKAMVFFKAQIQNTNEKIKTNIRKIFLRDPSVT